MASPVLSTHSQMMMIIAKIEVYFVLQRYTDECEIDACINRDRRVFVR